RGGKILIYQDMIHNYCDSKNGILRYRCRKRTCKGTVYLKENEILNFVEHSHQPMVDEIKAINRRLEVRKLSKENKEPSDKIVLKIFQNDKYKSEKMPSMSYIRDYVKKLRNNLANFQPREFNDIPYILKIDKKGNPFLRFDSGFADDKRFLIFFSEFKKNFF
ncbi:hypothetical protein DMUE_5768, partial [Dictyocoela muelleri]